MRRKGRQFEEITGNENSCFLWKREVERKRLLIKGLLSAKEKELQTTRRKISKEGLKKPLRTWRKEN